MNVPTRTHTKYNTTIANSSVSKNITKHSEWDLRNGTNTMLLAEAIVDFTPKNQISSASS